VNTEQDNKATNRLTAAVKSRGLSSLRIDLKVCQTGLKIILFILTFLYNINTQDSDWECRIEEEETR
jgi:hypothetical protein